MRVSMIVFGVSTLLGGIASAQPTEPGTGTTDVNPQPPPQPPQPPPQPPPQQPPVEHAAPAPAPPSPVKPSELAFAIGVGYTRPPGGSLDLQTPNIASVRLRLTSGLTFEPIISIANSSTETVMPLPNTTMTDTTTNFTVGTLVRLPVITHRNVDLEVLGSLGFGVVKVNPDGDYNTKTTTSLDLGWGLAIGYWITHNWQLSASATNPLVGYSSLHTQIDQNNENKNTTTSFEVTFNPTIFMMLHLYN